MTQTDPADSRRLLAQAREDLYLGDTRQASEKGWMAVLLMVQSVAEQRGWEHQDHAALYCVIRDLTAETGDADVRRLFAVAVSLETNCYENWTPAVSLDACLDDIALLLDKLEPLVNFTPARNQTG